MSQTPVVTDIKALSGAGSLFDRSALRTSRLGKWGIGIGAVVVLALAAPLLWTALGGLAAAALLVGGGSALLAAEKPLQNYLRTKRLEMLMNGAKKRPVETRLMLAQDAEARINAQVAVIGKFRTVLNNFELRSQQLAADQPEMAQAYGAIADNQRKLLEKREAAVKAAQENLAKYEEGTEKVRDLVEMNKSLAELREHSSALGVSFDDRLASDTVIFQVGQNLAESLGAMDQLAFEQDIADLRGSDLSRADKKLDSVAIAAGNIMSSKARAKEVEYIDR